MPDNNPCLICGACCAHYRVSFFWGECQSAGGSVPDETVIAINSTYVAMLGTDRMPSRCTALKGNIGQEVYCSIYSNRPSSCHNFYASWEFGEHHPDCDAARIAHGLAPLESPEK